MEKMSNEQALATCEQVRARNRGKWYTYQAWWCWGCSFFTKGDPVKRCYSSAPDNRGCLQVNQRFDQLHPENVTRA